MKEDQLINNVYQMFNKIFKDQNIKLYLFGSRSTMSATKYSDFDFCLKSVDGLKISVEKMESFKSLIEDFQDKETLFSIDVVDYYGLDKDTQIIVSKSLKEVDVGKS
jgi:DNA polymerase sigma